MKKQIYTFIGLIIVLTVSSVTAAYAQSSSNGRAHIPFDFSVKNRTVAAGDYVINRQDDRGAVWTIRSRDNRQSVILLAMNVGSKRTSDNGKMTFRRYGNKYFLASLEMPTCKVEFKKSRAERNLEEELENSNRLAKNNVNDRAPEIVHVEVGM